MRDVCLQFVYIHLADFPRDVCNAHAAVAVSSWLVRSIKRFLYINEHPPEMPQTLEGWFDLQQQSVPRNKTPV